MQYNIYSSPPAIILKPKKPFYKAISSPLQFIVHKYRVHRISALYKQSQNPNMQIYPILHFIPVRKLVPPNLLNKILPVISFE